MLVQQSRLGEIDRDELAEIITDAWAARAPRTLAKKFLQRWLTRSQPGRARHRGPRPPGRPRTRRGWRRWTCSRPSASTRPTPTSCCPPCCATTGCPAGTPRSSPSWCRGRSAGAGRTTRSSPPAWTGRSARWRPRSSTRCGSASTSCSRCGCRPTPRSARPWTWSGRGSAPGPSGFANAVLRKVAEHDLDEWIARVAPDPLAAPARYASIAYSHPQWVVEELRNAVGWPELHDLLAADNEPPRVTLVARPGRSTRDELPGEPTAVVAVRHGPRGRRPGRDPGRRRGPRRRPGRGLAAGRAGAGRGPGRPATTRPGSTCAPDPAARRRCWPRSPSGRGARLVAGERQPHRARLVARSLAGADGIARRRRRGRHQARRGGTGPSTGSSSTRRARGWERCGGGRRPAGGASPTTWSAWCCCSGRWSGPPSTSSGPGESCSTRPARRCWPRPPAWSARCSRPATDAVLEDATSLLPGVPDVAGPMPGTVQLWPHRHGTDAMFLALLRKV